MSENRERFQSLLKDLFQFDSADLDFGIYRIMNYKRDAIEKFINTDLPKAISEELSKGALADQTQAVKDLQEVTGQIVKLLGKDALDEDGNLADRFHDTEIGRNYLDLKSKAAGGLGTEALENTIFNHLYSFFNRYYQDGDFISKRRYSRKEKYAIPYNGEEVYLYWANNDQYYIKTSEQFHDYSFKSKGVTFRFKIKAADVEQDNVKGGKRFFIPLLDEIDWDEKASVLIVPFEYRPLTKQEEISFGKKNQQDAILEKTIEDIPNKLKKAHAALAGLTAERRKDGKGKKVTYLEHHLLQYTRRNTSDFFIHKDLRGFLSRELDFYLKNEVLNLNDMEAAGDELADGWFQVMRVIKAIGNRIILFLDQIENFQKMLWEKRKFVTETNYLITVGNIKEEFYPEIADCDAQWGEWKELFHIDENQKNLFTAGKSNKQKRIDFLKTHPTLVFDTANYSSDYADRILASIEDLDSVTDGLLINTDNFQAIALLDEKYRGKIKCIHIDPPYNTSTSGFLYKNEYQHSSWLSMMHNRISASKKLLTGDGAFLCHIDENEYEVLHLLCSKIGIPDGGTVVWDKKNPMLGRKGVATQHEYILWRTWVESPIYLRPTNIRKILAKAESLINQHGGVNDIVRKEFISWINNCEGLTGGERAYKLLTDDGRVFQSVAMGAPEPRTDPKFHIPLIHPVTKKECPVPDNGWSRAPETLKELMDLDEIVFGKDENTQPRRKVFLTDDSKRQISSIISDASRGKNDIDKLGLVFPYCHPVSLYEELLGAAAYCDDIVFDYFAGSGTTGHAVINLNREESGRRKFILAEMAEYFDTILLPRIKKITFASEWKAGKPKRMVTKEEAEKSPRIIKYIKIESYEDALNNIEFDDTSGQAGLKFEDYLLNYMLKWETRKSETLLNVEKLTRPFDYKLAIMDDGEIKKRNVDVPETFNYLLGLHVKTRQVIYDGDRKYLVINGQVENRSTVIIWRNTEGWEKKDLQRDKKFIEDHNLTADAEDVFVNGDSFIPDAKALEPLFKARMFAEVEA